MHAEARGTFEKKFERFIIHAKIGKIYLQYKNSHFPIIAHVHFDLACIVDHPYTGTLQILPMMCNPAQSQKRINLAFATAGLRLVMLSTSLLVINAVKVSLH